MMTWVVKAPNHVTKRGVKNADSAVPPMPAPKTPVAKPRRDGGYQALTNGMPTAKAVPAIPRKNPKINSSTYESMAPANATSSTGTMETSEMTVNIVRPP